MSDNNTNIFPTLQAATKMDSSINMSNLNKIKRQHAVTKGQYYISQNKKTFRGHYLKKLKLPSNNSMPMQYSEIENGMNNQSGLTSRDNRTNLNLNQNHLNNHISPQNYTEKEANDQLIEICENNGFTLAYAKQKGQNVSKLEIFFGSISRFNHFSPKLENLFVNLKILCIMNLKNLTIFPDFNYWPNLNELWICECNLLGEITENLNLHKNLPKLQKLFLYSNKIKKFDKIKLPKKLKIISLANNKLENFPKSVLNLEYLEDLNLANNFITSLNIIESNFNNSKNNHRTGENSISNAPVVGKVENKVLTLCENMKNLKKLELSANLITYPSELKYLKNLKNLESFSLCNPVYNFSNPICKLKAYTMIVLSYFQNHKNLKKLDSYPLQISRLKIFLSKLIYEKRKYYFMISRTVLLENYNKIKNWRRILQR